MVKKIITGFVMICAVLFLVACTKEETKTKFQGSISEKVVEIEKTTIQLQLVIEDKKDQIDGTINGSIYKADDLKKAIQVKTLSEHEDEEETKNLYLVEFTSLLENTEYVIQVSTVIEGKSTIIYEKRSVKTLVTRDYTIATAEEFFEKIKADPRGNFLVTENLDFTNHPVTADNRISDFRGTFDGGNKIMSNIVFQQSSISGGTASLFGRLQSKAVIKNVHLKHVSMGLISEPLSFTSNSGIGIIASRTYVSSELSAIKVEQASIYVTFEGTATNFYLGGLVGRNYSKVVDLSVDQMTIDLRIKQANQVHVGGIFGESAKDTSIDKLYSNADIEVKIDSSKSVKDKFYNVNIGGLIGTKYEEVRNRVISNLASIGSITLETTKITTHSDSTLKNTPHRFNIGGLIGYNQNEIKSSIAQHDISIIEGGYAFSDENAPDPTHKYEYNVGGLVGMQAYADAIKAVLISPNIVMHTKNNEFSTYQINLFIGNYDSKVTGTVPAIAKQYVLYGSEEVFINQTKQTFNGVVTVDLAAAKAHLLSTWIDTILDRL